MVEKLNIYEPITFSLVNQTEGKYETNSLIHNRIQKLLVPENSRVITKCLDCNHEHTFFVYKTNVLYSKENDNKTTNGTISYAMIFDGAITYPLNLDSCISDDYVFNKLYDADYYINYLCRCSNNYSHIQTITLRVILKNGELTLIKVGQDPINTELVSCESKFYQKQLRKFSAEEDFKNAIRSKDRNLYAGAATYLRRVFEKIVRYYLDEEGINPKGKRMEELVGAIRNYLDGDFYAYSKSLYELLSKGIHELGENEVLEMFETLYGAIRFQLDFEKNKDDSKAKKDEISKSIRQLKQKNNSSN